MRYKRDRQIKMTFGYICTSVHNFRLADRSYPEPVYEITSSFFKIISYTPLFFGSSPPVGHFHFGVANRVLPRV
jgi:hypothetical protein